MLWGQNPTAMLPVDRVSQKDPIDPASRPTWVFKRRGPQLADQATQGARRPGCQWLRPRATYDKPMAIRRKRSRLHGQSTAP